MKKTTSLLATILFSILTSFGQTGTTKEIPTKDGMFCGKVGESGKTGGNYTLAELKNCDWKITSVDTSYTVTEFRMSLVPKDDSYKYSEQEVKGNTIPETYRNQILTHTRNVFLEYIKAVNKKGESVLVKPIAVRIHLD
ncbi:MAG: hypothetical protein ACHQNT_02050 [Bacteroidia bacterium]|jgi:hypothetical protein